MKFKNKKLILFDLDGTLIDSVPDLANAVNYTLEKINKKKFKENIIRQWVGNGAKTLVARALSGSVNIDKNLSTNEIENALEIFLDFYSKNLSVKTTMYPNVKQTLEYLKNKEYIMVIITNKPYAFIKPILEYLDILNLFDDYLGADSLAKKKPSPMPLLYVCEKFNIDISAAIMIGDSKNDILSANSANIESIAVTYGYNYDEDISIYNPTIVFDDFIKIKEVL
jgi:phosphoglycolate phosphatase